MSTCRDISMSMVVTSMHLCSACFYSVVWCHNKTWKFLLVLFKQYERESYNERTLKIGRGLWECDRQVVCVCVVVVYCDTVYVWLMCQHEPLLLHYRPQLDIWRLTTTRRCRIILSATVYWLTNTGHSLCLEISYFLLSIAYSHLIFLVSEMYIFMHIDALFCHSTWCPNINFDLFDVTLFSGGLGT